MIRKQLNQTPESFLHPLIIYHLLCGRQRAGLTLFRHGVKYRDPTIPLNCASSVGIDLVQARLPGERIERMPD
jgi:hypothetical protein